MKTAIELADEFPEQNLANIEPDAVNHLNWWGLEAMAMLLQQAEQIEALKALVDNPRNTPFGKEAEKLADEWLAANGPGGWIDDLRNKCEALEIVNTALKADAERYQWLRKHVVFGYCSPEGCNSDDVYLTITGYKAFPQTGKTVDAAIDAMKGKS